MTCTFIAVLLLPAAVFGQRSFAELTPADGVTLFVELHDGTGLLRDLTEPRVWTTLAEIAGQPADISDTTAWRARIRRVTGMPPEQAIETLLARGVAYAATGAANGHDAVMFCRPGAATPPQELLDRWGARRLESPELAGEVFLLPDNIAVLAHGDILVFGDALIEGGLFRRVARLCADATDTPRLSAAEDFARLSRAAEATPAGVLFLRNAAPTSRPAASLFAGPLGDARTILLAMERNGERLVFRAAGDAPNPELPPGLRTRALESLPAETLAAIEFQLDLRQLVRSTATVPAGSVVQLARQLPRQREALDRLTELLEPSTCVALGALPHRDGSPPAPAVAMLLTPKPGAAAEARDVLDGLIRSAVTVYDFMALARGGPPMPVSADPAVGIGGAIDLGPLVGPDFARHVPLEVCWGGDDEGLIVSTSSAWLRTIVAARSGAGSPLGAPVAPGERPLRNALVVEAGRIAQVGSAWLEWIRRTSPDALTESWWRARQPGGDQNVLGIDVRNDAENQRLLVQTVSPGGNSHGLLRAGDHIVGINGRKFQTARTIREIRDGIRSRPSPRWVELLVERDGVTRRLRVPIPFFQPVEALRRVVALGGLIERVSYSDVAATGDISRGVLALDLAGRSGASSLVSPAAATNAAASQPAATSQPAEAAQPADARQPGDPPQPGDAAGD